MVVPESGERVQLRQPLNLVKAARELKEAELALVLRLVLAVMDPPPLEE